jgi:hypothetical protein
MTEFEIKKIKNLLKIHYGSTKIVVDNDLMFVYGSNVDAVHTAMVVEYGSDYNIFCESRNDLLKEVILRFVKKE